MLFFQACDVKLEPSRKQLPESGGCFRRSFFTPGDLDDQVRGVRTGQDGLHDTMGRCWIEDRGGVPAQKVAVSGALGH